MDSQSRGKAGKSVETEETKMSGMEIAVWVIAACEVVRALQNAVQIAAIKHDSKGRDNAYAEFVKSLKQTDREFVRQMLEEFERQEGKEK